MKVGILGTGIVGQSLATRIQAIGQDVMLGTHDAAQLMKRPASVRLAMPFVEWRQRNPEVKLGAFAEAAAHGEVVFNCTSAGASLKALELAGEGNLAGKVPVDIANPLAPGEGQWPFLSVSNTDWLGEQIQRAFPKGNTCPLTIDRKNFLRRF